MRFRYIYFYEYIFKYHKDLVTPESEGLDDADEIYRFMCRRTSAMIDYRNGWDKYIDRHPWETRLPSPNLYDEA